MQLPKITICFDQLLTFLLLLSNGCVPPVFSKYPSEYPNMDIFYIFNNFIKKTQTKINQIPPNQKSKI